MRYLRWIITILLVVGYGSVFGQSQPNKASIMEDAFGAIRAEMVRDACNILEFDNQDAICLIKNSNQSINAFDNALMAKIEVSDDLTTKYLHYIISDAHKTAGKLSGDQLDRYETGIKNFRSRILFGYEEGDRLKTLFGDDTGKLAEKKDQINKNNQRYIDTIIALVGECKTYNELEANGKLNEYKGSVFRPLIDNNKGGVIPTPAPKPKPEQTDIDKKAWDDCVKTFESVVRFIKNNPNNIYVPEADEWLWNDIIGKKNATIQDYRNYLDSRSNAIHKTEAEERIKELEQEKDLNDCNKWSTFEEMLEKWQEDQAFVDRLFEKRWDYCVNRHKLEDYKRYVEYADRYEVTLHYQEAQKAIEDLSGYWWYLLAAMAIVSLLLVILIRKRKKAQSQPVSDDKELREENAAFERCSTISACDYYLNTYPNGRFVKEVIAKKDGILDKLQKEEDEAFKACTTVTACDFYLIKYPKGKYVNAVKEKKAKLTDGGNNTKPKEPENKPKQKQGEWVVVGASVKGNGHIQSNMPCQDNNKFELLGKGWGVAVVSDGAGSAAHSDMGSKVVVERAVVHFKNLIDKEGWMEKNKLPSDAEWLQKSYFVLKTIRNEVEMVAKKNNVDVKSLSATCLAVVFSPMGLLVVHVGDGRMGCKTMSGEWKAIMTPHKGEEANQTLFLVSDFWDIPNYVQSGVLVPESIVVREPVEAFAVMSDGCESTAWLCTAQNAETGKYYDQNKPFEGFFNPLEETLVTFHKDNVPEEERKEKWYKFIESGTKGFVKEQDDKTMILGVFCGK